MRFRVAGLEVSIETNAPAVAAELLGAWQGYASKGGDPDIQVRYESVPGFAVEQPPGREYPGFAATATTDGMRLQRRDARGLLRVPDDGPVTADFAGMDRPYSLEACLRLAVAAALPRVGGLVLHSAGVLGATTSLLFCGPSGAGKSTIARLLGLPRLGDDLTAVRPDASGRQVAHATPFAGELGPAPDAAAPLSAIHFLRQARRHQVTRIAPAAAVPLVLRNTMAYVVEARTARRVLAAAAALVGEVSCHVLDFAMDPSVAEVLKVT
jgi:hypothetical protein